VSTVTICPCQERERPREGHGIEGGAAAAVGRSDVPGRTESSALARFGAPDLPILRRCKNRNVAKSGDVGKPRIFANWVKQVTICAAVG